MDEYWYQYVAMITYDLNSLSATGFSPVDPKNWKADRIMIQWRKWKRGVSEDGSFLVSGSLL
jgi:hypothetical protein